MQEIMLKTHLIITDIHDEYHMKWCGKIADATPELNKQGLPKFVIVGNNRRIEVNTIDINYLERCAKMLTSPKGRSAVAVDKAYIFIKEVNGNEMRIGTLTHKRIKTFAPMYDAVGYK